MRDRGRAGIDGAGRIADKCGRQALDEGWSLVMLHHTECGIIGCSRRAPALLGPHMGIQEADFDTVGIADTYQSVAFDVAALKENHALPVGLTVSGAVYEVATVSVNTVVAVAPLRSAALRPEPARMSNDTVSEKSGTNCKSFLHYLRQAGHGEVTRK